MDKSIGKEIGKEMGNEMREKKDNLEEKDNFDSRLDIQIADIVVSADVVVSSVSMTPLSPVQDSRSQLVEDRGKDDDNVKDRDMSNSDETPS